MIPGPLRHTQNTRHSPGLALSKMKVLCEKSSLETLGTLFALLNEMPLRASFETFGRSRVYIESFGRVLKKNFDGDTKAHNNMK